MKRKILKTFTIATGMLAISFLAFPIVSGQTEQRDVTTYSSQIGCYAPVTLDCGFGLGEQLWCNFTGSWGAPYQCTDLDCYGGQNHHTCVQKTE